MEKFLYPTTQQVMSAPEILFAWFKNNPEWKPIMEEDIEIASKGEFRVFHTFFENPSEALSG